MSSVCYTTMVMGCVWRRGAMYLLYLHELGYGDSGPSLGAISIFLLLTLHLSQFFFPSNSLSFPFRSPCKSKHRLLSYIVIMTVDGVIPHSIALITNIVILCSCVLLCSRIESTRKKSKKIKCNQQKEKK